MINSAFYPALMLNSRFVALSGDPFDNSLGFQFPAPESTTRFPPGDPRFPTLLSAQGHIPETELVEMAGFNGASRNPIFDPKFHQFDDGLGTRLPQDGDGDGFLGGAVRSNRSSSGSNRGCAGSAGCRTRRLRTSSPSSGMACSIDAPRRSSRAA